MNASAKWSGSGSAAPVTRRHIGLRLTHFGKDVSKVGPTMRRLRLNCWCFQRSACNWNPKEKVNVPNSLCSLHAFVFLPNFLPQLSDYMIINMTVRPSIQKKNSFNINSIQFMGSTE